MLLALLTLRFWLIVVADIVQLDQSLFLMGSQDCQRKCLPRGVKGDLRRARSELLQVKNSQHWLIFALGALNIQAAPEDHFLVLRCCQKIRLHRGNFQSRNLCLVALERLKNLIQRQISKVYLKYGIVADG